MSDRRSGTERRVEDLQVEVDRREEERRSKDPLRRQVMDRRVQSTPVENDRRKGLRRTAEKEATSKGEEAVPDWMEEALADAAKRNEEFPSMSPPPVDKKENEFMSKDEYELFRQQRLHDYFIMAFVTASLICLFFTIFWM